MNQTVNLGLTGLVSLIVGVAGGHAYTSSIQATKVTDLTGQIAILQKKIDAYEAAAKVETPSNDEALAAVRKNVYDWRLYQRVNAIRPRGLAAERRRGHD